MAGMKVTLSAAMRARDVSRPRPDDVAAVEAAGAADVEPAVEAEVEGGAGAAEH